MSALADLYAAQAAEARNRIGLSNAQMDLTEQQARQFAPTAEAQRSLLGAQADLTQNQARMTAPLDQSMIDLRGAQAGLFGNQAGAIFPQLHSSLLTQGLQRALTSDYLTPTPPSGIGAAPDIGGTTPHFAGGTNDAKRAKGGKGKRAQPKADTRMDTVPALLSPGEAVLNRGAAEHIGRGIIAHLNAIGLQRMAQQGLASPAPSEASRQVPTTQKSAQKAQGAKSRGKTSSQGTEPAVAHYAGGVAEILHRLFGSTAQADAAPVTGDMAAHGGPIGLGGGVLQGQMPTVQPFTQIPFIYEPPVATAQPPSDARIAAASAAPAGVDIVRGGRMAAAPQNFAAGVEEVLPVTSTMTGLDARALAGRKADGDELAPGGIGGMPKKLAKGATRVAQAKGSKGSSKTLQTPVPMPTAAQVAPPAATVPQMSMPQAQIPNF